MKRYPRIALTLAATLVSAAVSAQSPTNPPASQPSAFPEALLQGRPAFDLAVFYQGDLRGNFGPCG